MEEKTFEDSFKRKEECEGKIKIWSNCTRKWKKVCLQKGEKKLKSNKK